MAIWEDIALAPLLKLRCGKHDEKHGGLQFVWKPYSSNFQHRMGGLVPPYEMGLLEKAVLHDGVGPCIL